jgi:N-acetylmuramoyl-L-alanine amidase
VGVKPNAKITGVLGALAGALLLLAASSASPLSATAAVSASAVAATSSVPATGSVRPTGSVPATGSASPTASVPATFVVVIDPGHQGIVDKRLEPIGPGSKIKKPAVAAGTRGTWTHTPESKRNLQIALRLRDVLRADGVKVIMVRTSQNVDITNSQRAKIANNAHADLFIRLHCDGVADSSVHGITVLTPGKNKWTGPIVVSSKAAAKLVDRDVIKTTKAKNRGVKPRTDLAGFNWCKVPTVLVEMGFMTNHAEDRLMATTTYQKKLAAGLAQGALDYYASTHK